MEPAVEESSALPPLAASGRWRSSILAALVVTVVVLLAFHDSVTAAVAQWVSSGAYNHCFLIIPIALYLIWADRAGLKTMVPHPSIWGIALVIPFGVAWFFSYISGIAEFAQFAVIGVIQGVLLGLLGGQIYRRLLFPFWYLWLAVPSGQFLVPTLQRWTAQLAGGLLDLTWVPTFHEGLMIEVPSGSYVVAPGCSGLNFLLAGAAIAIAFAQLSYRSWARRVGFVIAVLLLAIAGNAVRVFLIILVAHMTNNVGDIVDDHLLYGWGFFTLLLWGAMAIGYRFHQDAAKGTASPTSSTNDVRLWPTVTLTLGVAVVAPVAAWAGWSGAASAVAPSLTLSCGVFDPIPVSSDWIASASQVDALAVTDCRLGSNRVHLAVAMFDRPVRQGKLLGLEHRLIDGNRWPVAESHRLQVEIGGRLVPVVSEVLGQESRTRLVWSLRWVDGAWTAAGFETALADLKADLAGRRRAGLVLVATEADEGDSVLKGFLAQLPLDDIMGRAAPISKR